MQHHHGGGGEGRKEYSDPSLFVSVAVTVTDGDDVWVVGDSVKGEDNGDGDGWAVGAVMDGLMVD